jgi:hypothetical protein
MKKLLLLLISFLGIFSACEREHISPIPPTPGGSIDSTIICLYGIRTAVYETKAAAENAALAEEQREIEATKENVTVD